jgi:hypothetical protein
MTAAPPTVPMSPFGRRVRPGAGVLPNGPNNLTLGQLLARSNPGSLRATPPPPTVTTVTPKPTAMSPAAPSSVTPGSAPTPSTSDPLYPLGWAELAAQPKPIINPRATVRIVGRGGASEGSGPRSAGPGGFGGLW